MSTNIVRREPDEPTDLAPSTLFGTANPADAMARIVDVANVLQRVLKERQLVTKIGAKKHVNVEGWTLLGSLLGVFPSCEWTRPILNDEGKRVGWEARVVARTRAGEIVGAAESMCMSSESFAKGKAEYAVRSMAQTRATSRALRQPLDFIVKLAGFEAVGAEEMPSYAPPSVESGTDPEFGEGSRDDPDSTERTGHDLRPVPPVEEGDGSGVLPSNGAPSPPGDGPMLIEIERERLGWTKGALLKFARAQIGEHVTTLDWSVLYPEDMDKLVKALEES